MPVEFLWTIASLILTLMVFSYILGDNFLFRIAIYLFIGVTAGYTASLLIYQVIIPRLALPLVSGSLGERILTLIPAAGSILIIFRLSPRFSRLGNLPMAYLVGAGAGIVIGGAVLGTILGQAKALIAPFDLKNGFGLLLEALFVLIGTLTTLAYFTFSTLSKNNQTSKRPVVLEILAGIGQVFIAITLGTLFAGVYTAAITALIERLDFIRIFLFSFFR
jgi:hypothetical protein